MKKDLKRSFLDEEENDDMEKDVFTNDEIKKLENSRNGILVGGFVFLVVLVFVVGWYFLFFNNPTHIYKKLIIQSINTLSSVRDKCFSKENVTIKTSMEINAGFSAMDKDMLDFFNKTTSSFNYQMDESSKRLFLNLNANYNKEELLNYDLLIDGNSRMMYVYSKDLYDKHLSSKLDDNPLYMSIFTFLEETPEQLDEQVDWDKIQEIISEELSDIVKSDDCYKEDDFFVFEIKISELMERIEDMLEDLADNKEFLDCFEDERTAKEFLEGFRFYADDYSSNESIKVSISLKYNKLERIIISIDSSNIVLDVQDNIIDYSIETDGQELISGYFKVVDEKNIRKIEFLFDIPMYADIKFKINIIDNGDPNIKVIDGSNIKVIDEMTYEEKIQILINLQNSKIYSLLEVLGGSTLNNLDYNTNNKF